MSLFNTILEKLGLGQAAATTPTASSTQPSSAPNNPASNQTSASAGTQSAAGKTVDVTAKLDQLAAANAQKLNWKTSIVDLLKLLNLDSSLDARKKLAHELGYTASTDDSAQMNIWLHKEVLTKIAANGGNVPKDLL